MTQQVSNPKKISISQLVEEFVLHRWQAGQPRFLMQDLHNYILARTRLAPASPGRILRQLRQKGKFDYQVVDRRDSCYELLNIGSSRAARRRRTVTLLHRGRPVDHFERNGKKFRLPAHVIDHLFASNDFELQIG